MGYVDTTYAKCLKTRRCITGLMIHKTGAPLAYREKMKPIGATSSTGAQFIAAVFLAKTIKFLRNVLKDLDVEQKNPATIYIDNKAAIMMGNNHTRYTILCTSKMDSTKSCSSETHYGCR